MRVEVEYIVDIGLHTCSVASCLFLSLLGARRTLLYHIACPCNIPIASTNELCNCHEVRLASCHHRPVCRHRCRRVDASTLWLHPSSASRHRCPSMTSSPTLAPMDTLAPAETCAYTEPAPTVEVLYARAKTVLTVQWQAKNVGNRVVVDRKS